jgi:exosortase A-associated hydrolase 1
MQDERALVLGCEGEPLVAILHLPPGPLAQCCSGVVVVVGGPQYRVGSHRQFVITARALAAAGHAVLRFDLRGMGDSAAPARTFEQVAADIRCAVDGLLAAAPAVRQVALWGLCDGASAAAMYCQGDVRITHLVLANPWVRGAVATGRVMLRHYYLKRITERSFWAKLLSLRVNPLSAAGGIAGTVARTAPPQAGASNFVEQMREGLENFRGAVLLLVSERDLTAREFLDLCSGDRRWKRLLQRPATSRVDLEGADHTFSSRAHLDAANAACIDWLRVSAAPRRG